jgi:asparagine synthase (glutamine-hydrolysing)
VPGITGIINKTSHEKNIEDLQLMMNSMMHESMYNVGSYINEHMGIYLGWVCHKDSFVDCMPIWNEKKDKCLLFYGENFLDKQIIDSLRKNGHIFNPNNAGYLIHLVEEKGSNFFSYLNGFFNGVLVDVARDEVILFNDRYGMQRVYYYENKRKFIFSSEAKSLIKICPELREISPAGLGQRFTIGCTLDNNTLFRNIFLLPNASLWRFKNGDCEKKDKYFDEKKWEHQDSVEKERFYSELRETFIRILPKYLNDSKAVGMSLTGGLDTRMIMAHAQRAPGTFPCYTFGSMYRDSFDVIVARKVARTCNQKHYTLRVDNEFLSNFPYLAEKTVYISDGYLNANDATELYVNRLAREIAPIRITGNYGSEVLRSIRAFKAKPPNKSLFSVDFIKNISLASEEFLNHANGHNLSFAVFKQAPWFNYNRLSLEQSQLTMRTPFMDNELISLLYKAPSEVLLNDEISLRLIEDGNIELSRIMTNRGVWGNSFYPLSRLIPLYYETLRLGEICYDYGMPQWFSGVDHYLKFFHIEKIFLGRHNFYFFRYWFRDKLAGYVKDILLDSRTLNRPYLNKGFVKKMVLRHLKGDRNYTREINLIITAELIHRLLIEQR